MRRTESSCYSKGEFRHTRKGGEVAANPLPLEHISDGSTLGPARFREGCFAVVRRRGWTLGRGARANGQIIEAPLNPWLVES
jgi:hypothetical protein